MNQLLVVVLVGLLSLLGGGTYAVVVQPQPQVRGVVRLAGLQGPVEVARDRWGVPHITAQNEADLFFAQGYVTAQDRLWQMELSRRAGLGRLSEAFGRAALEADQVLRTLGLAQAAEAFAAAMRPETARVLGAYAAGVNAWIASHRNRLPLEFSLLGLQPEPWTPRDAFAVAGAMAVTLQDYFNTILQRARAQAALAPERFAELDQPYDTRGAFGVDADGGGQVVAATGSATPVATSPLDAATLAALGAFSRQVAAVSDWLPLGGGVGSNAWAVDGARSASGKPYLANDPHLPPRQPATWYGIQLEAPGWQVTGASLPGIPGVVLGHNAHIAWGITNGYLAVQDLFLEKPNSQRSHEFEFQGQWEAARVIQDPIAVKGEAQPVAHEVVFTRHGPLITDLAQFPQPVALGWTFSEARGGELGGLLEINRAADWAGFRRGVAQVAFDLNFVYADVAGNIGLQMSGRLPRRPAGYQGLPVPGWTGDHEWDGWVEPENLPHAYNPKTHFVVTANHRPFGPGLLPDIAGEWSVPLRAQRITALLAAGEAFTLEDMRNIQADAYSAAYDQLAQWLKPLHPASDLERRALEAISDWDGVVREDSVAAVIVDRVARAAVALAFTQKLGDAADFVGFQKGVYLLLRIGGNDPSSPWFDLPDTPQVEGLAQLLARSLTNAVEGLSQEVGPIERWTWGRLKRVTFSHPLGALPVVGGVFNRTSATVGGRLTVNRDNTSFRLLVDLSDFDRSLGGLTTGQAGHPFSSHYADQLEDWRHVRPHPLLWSPAQVGVFREGLLVLKPK